MQPLTNGLHDRGGSRWLAEGNCPQLWPAVFAEFGFLSRLVFPCRSEWEDRCQAEVPAQTKMSGVDNAG